MSSAKSLVYFQGKRFRIDFFIPSIKCLSYGPSFQPLVTGHSGWPHSQCFFPSEYAFNLLLTG